MSLLFEAFFGITRVDEEPVPRTSFPKTQDMLQSGHHLGGAFSPVLLSQTLIPQSPRS